MTIFYYLKNYQKLFSIMLSFTFMAFNQPFAIANTNVEEYQPITTKNITIDLNELDYLITPLTKDELSIEVDAWLILLKEKATILSDAEIYIVKNKKLSLPLKRFQRLVLKVLS